MGEKNDKFSFILEKFVSKLGVSLNWLTLNKNKIKTENFHTFQSKIIFVLRISQLFRKIKEKSIFHEKCIYIITIFNESNLDFSNKGVS